LRNPQSLNKYQYALNNPQLYVDPDGHDPDETLDQDPQQQPTPHPGPWVPRKITESNPYGLQLDDPEKTKTRLDGLEAQYKCEQGDCSGVNKIIPPVPIPPRPAPKPERSTVVAPELKKDRKQVFKEFPNRKRAIDARPRPLPAKPGEPHVTRQGKNMTELIQRAKDINEEGDISTTIDTTKTNRTCITVFRRVS
jgi:hypothetical protein